MDDYVINIFRDFQSQAPRPRIRPRLKSAHLLLGFPYYCLFGYWESLGKEKMYFLWGSAGKIIIFYASSIVFFMFLACLAVGKVQEKMKSMILSGK